MVNSDIVFSFSGYASAGSILLISLRISAKHRRADIHPFPHVNLTIGVVLQGIPADFKEILSLNAMPVPYAVTLLCGTIC